MRTSHLVKNKRLKSAPFNRQWCTFAMQTYWHNVKHNAPNDVTACVFVPRRQRTDHARNLKVKFERWEQKMEKERKFDDEEECRPSLETARNLRSMFEAMKDQPATPEKPRPKVNRFIVRETQANRGGVQSIE